MTLSVRKSLAVATALAASAALVLSTASAADAAPPLKVKYRATGSSVIASTNSTVTLGPAALSATVRPDGTFTATLPLPPTQTSFKALGLLPVTATVSFVRAAPVTGQIISDPTTRLTSTAHYYVKLSDVTAGGLPAFVGDNCQTADPVSIPASGPFSIVNGGTLTGTYSIGKFGNCGLTTGLINLLVPGDGNTVSLTLDHGRLG